MHHRSERTSNNFILSREFLISQKKEKEKEKEKEKRKEKLNSNSVVRL